MEMILIISIVAIYIMLIQIQRLQGYKRQINIITAFSIGAIFVFLIVEGIISGRAKSKILEMKDNYPIYLVVLGLALSIQWLIARKSKSKEKQ